MTQPASPTTTTPTVAPYGSWASPITSDLIVSGSVALGAICLDGGNVYWTEGRAAEAGRVVIVRRTPDGATSDLTPPPFNARTRVHEYGGGAYTVASGVVYFSNFSDNLLYRLDPGAAPRAITASSDLRYADLTFDAARNRLICVREDHRGEGEAVNTLVALNAGGDESGGTVLASGYDFYSSPRLSPDGARLAWLSWRHPNMPWDGSELWLADLAAGGALTNARQVAGGPEESIFQPEWSPAGALTFVSDRTGWWNLYRLGADGQAEALHPLEAEFGVPQWAFGLSTYAFADDHTIICAYSQGGAWQLARLDTAAGAFTLIETPYTLIGNVRVANGAAYLLAASPTAFNAVVRLDLTTGSRTVLRRSADLSLDPAYISVPEPIEFPTEGSLTAHAFFYAPKNPNFTAPEEEKPPLVVHSHGGPTSATGAVLSLNTQYWTTRGFAVVDVNYGGSTGFGRPYRERLNGQWGEVDVDDCVNAAKYLAARGLVDPARLVITGGSAGGYTTLRALTARDVFKAGASHFGLSDLEGDFLLTHKFESRYSVHLVGPYPEAQETYHQRSPIHFADQVTCPVYFTQGLDDKIVLPGQAQKMVAILRERGIPVAYLEFAGEGHGFRKAENIKRSLDGELYFYSRVFGFPLAGPVEPVQIDNLPA